MSASAVSMCSDITENKEMKEAKETVEKLTLSQWSDLNVEIESGDEAVAKKMIEKHTVFLKSENHWIATVTQKAIDNGRKAVLAVLLSLKPLKEWEYNYTLIAGCLPLESALKLHRIRGVAGNGKEMIELLKANAASCITSYTNKDITGSIESVIKDGSALPAESLEDGFECTPYSLFPNLSMLAAFSGHVANTAVSPLASGSGGTSGSSLPGPA